LKIAAIVPVKSFSNAKTRLDLTKLQKEQLCEIMLEEILHTLSISPQIEKILVVTKEKKAIDIGKKFQVIHILDSDEKSVNNAVEIADKYLQEHDFDASIVIPQDIPFIKTQDIDFVLNYKIPPNFVIVVPSRRFDGTNALIRMPVNLMKTHYDEDSYKIHMNTAKAYTRNVALVFAKRIMWDIDNMEDLNFLVGQNEKPDLVQKIKQILNQKQSE